MKTQEIAIKLGAVILFIVFILLSYFLGQPLVSKVLFERTGEFGQALWNYRKLDVFIQVVLIFSAALGILTFFAEKEK